jgi:hypothetical protein
MSFLKIIVPWLYQKTRLFFWEMYTEVFSSDGQIVFNLLSIVYLNRHMCIFIAGQTNYLAENFQEYKNHNNQVMETTKMPHY